MLIALALAAAAIAAPPVTLRVHAASTIPRAIVSAAIDEAAAIWRVPGVPLVAEIDQADVTTSPIAVDRQSLPLGASLRVIVEEGAPTVKDYVATIGWIVFASGGSIPEIHLSYTNAYEIMRGAYTDGGLSQMTIAQRRTFLARALGRALAHEIGHYLIGSKEHTRSGLMKARHTAGDLFGPERRGFVLSAADRSTAVARLAEGERLAWR